VPLLHPPSLFGGKLVLPFSPTSCTSQIPWLGLPHPFWEQGIAILKVFLEFGNTACPKQSLLWTSLEYLQLKTGIGSPVLWVTLWGHLATPCWVKNLWSFAHLADIQLICEPSITPALQQQGNRCLMDWAGHQNLSSQDLAAFNCCQLAHRVYFLSDIMDGGSHSLCNLILLPPASPSMSSWHWPWAATVQKDWAIWQCLLPAGHHYHSRPMAQVSSPLCIHPIWPYHDNGLYCLAWLLLADLLPSQPPCNMADTYALPFSNCPWTTSELLFCMYPPLVQKWIWY